MREHNHRPGRLRPTRALVARHRGRRDVCCRFRHASRACRGEQEQLPYRLHDYVIDRFRDAAMGPKPHRAAKRQQGASE